MAITIRQSPTQPNMTNNNLVYTVTSNMSDVPQYQFVADLTYSGSNTVLQRVKQQPNPNNAGVFDMGAIISNYLDSDNNWKTYNVTGSNYMSKRFQVKFGEQYGTSASSSVILYTGVAAITGSPAVTASDYLYVLNGLVDPNDKINWNWPSASYYTNVRVDSTASYSYQHALTNAPYTQSIQDGEYATISLINGNFNGSTTLAQDVFGAEIYVYDATGSEIDQLTIRNESSTGGGPRDLSSDFWSVAVASQSAYTQLITFGVGPQNLEGAFGTLLPNWAYYDAVFYGSRSSGGVSTFNYSGSFASYRFIKQGPQCGYDGVRFAWKNEFGVWDYYTFTLQTDKAYSIERANYEQTFVPFGSSYPVPYDTERRGLTNYYNKPIQTQLANSNWLTQAEADWLKELFFSANVFQQDGDEFYPIVITSVNLTEKTNPRTQRNFQYTIEFQPANQINPRI